MVKWLDLENRFRTLFCINEYQTFSFLGICKFVQFVSAPEWWIDWKSGIRNRNNLLPSSSSKIKRKKVHESTHIWIRFLGIRNSYIHTSFSTALRHQCHCLVLIWLSVEVTVGFCACRRGSAAFSSVPPHPWLSWKSVFATSNPCQTHWAASFWVRRTGLRDREDGRCMKTLGIIVWQVGRGSLLGEKVLQFLEFCRLSEVCETCLANDFNSNFLHKKMKGTMLY